MSVSIPTASAPVLDSTVGVAAQNLGEQARTRQHSVQHAHRQRTYHHTGLASTTGVLAPLRHLDLEAAGHPLQKLAVLSAYELLVAASLLAAAILGSRLADVGNARQMRRHLASDELPSGTFISSRWRCGRVFRSCLIEREGISVRDTTPFHHCARLRASGIAPEFVTIFSSLLVRWEEASGSAFSAAHHVGLYLLR